MVALSVRTINNRTNKNNPLLRNPSPPGSSRQSHPWRRFSIVDIIRIYHGNKRCPGTLPQLTLPPLAPQRGQHFSLRSAQLSAPRLDPPIVPRTTPPIAQLCARRRVRLPGRVRVQQHSPLLSLLLGLQSAPRPNPLSSRLYSQRHVRPLVLHLSQVMIQLFALLSVLQSAQLFVLRFS